MAGHAARVGADVVMLVIMASAAVGWIMTFVQAPQLFAQWCIETLQAPWLIILAMVGIMLVTGMFIDCRPPSSCSARSSCRWRRRSASTSCSSGS